MGQPVLVAEKLRIEANPFLPGANGARAGRPLQTALGEVIRQIGLETPVVIVAGSAGTGKTLLANMAMRACSDMGLSVRQVHRGDLMDGAAGERADLLLVDEADSMTHSTLQTLLPEGGKRPATTTVLLCLPSSVRRFSSAVDAAVIELTRLSLSDTRAYLLERATNARLPDLFAPAALELIVDGSRGLPRLLCSIASLAYFSAAYDGSSRISREHVAGALASQMTRREIQDNPAQITPIGDPDAETGVKSPERAPVADQDAPNARACPCGERRQLGSQPVGLVLATGWSHRCIGSIFRNCACDSCDVAERERQQGDDRERPAGRGTEYPQAARLRARGPCTACYLSNASGR